MQSKLNKDIQGLRALAVLSVLIYHVWPFLLPGGYVGVDVFFVLSGFLMTQLLLREIEHSERLLLWNFYARRINRLLPAASIVLIISGCFLAVLPPLEWINNAMHALASAFYVQNWLLATQATNYLASDNSVTLFQHYWSLSVEEQFYLVWPLLLLLALLISAKFKICKRVMLGGVIWLTLILGLCYSVTASTQNPSWAYFSTLSRVWEFALGGCIATIRQTNVSLFRRGAGFIGVLCILVASIWFSNTTVFPGYLALLPTLGAALVIIGSQHSMPIATRFLRIEPMQFIGALSYSLYLWHWPLITAYQQFTKLAFGVIDGLLVIVLSIGLAYLTKRQIEDRFRYRDSRTAAKILFLSLLAPAIAFFIIKYSLSQLDHSTRSSSIKSDRVGYISALSARRDLPMVYELGCHVPFDSAEPKRCEFGQSDSETTVAIVGDSHAAQWVPALREIARERGIKLISYTKSACNISLNDRSRQSVRYEYCNRWRREVFDALLETRPTLTILSQVRTYAASSLSNPVMNNGDFSKSERSNSKSNNSKSSHPKSNNPESNSHGSGKSVTRVARLAQGLTETMSFFEDAGLSAVLLSDTPQLKKNVPVCLSRFPLNSNECNSGKKPIADPIMLVPLRSKHRVIDMNDVVCASDVCKAVINDTIVWQDKHHLTATYSRSLAKPLWKKLLALEPSLARAKQP